VTDGLKFALPWSRARPGPDHPVRAPAGPLGAALLPPAPPSGPDAYRAAHWS